MSKVTPETPLATLGVYTVEYRVQRIEVQA